MLQTSSRLLALLSLIQHPGGLSGTEIARRLAVTPRTVRNDIDRLRTLGYPVDASRGTNGRYRLGAGASLPPLLLDDDEAVAVAIGLSAAGGVGGVEESSTRALLKLEQVLPDRLRRQIRALHRSTSQAP
ncbi:MAG TPA: HTH domain-containing protein, partial [Galbitalea sp.]